MGEWGWGVPAAWFLWQPERRERGTGTAAPNHSYLQQVPELTTPASPRTIRPVREAGGEKAFSPGALCLSPISARKRPPTSPAKGVTEGFWRFSHQPLATLQPTIPQPPHGPSSCNLCPRLVFFCPRGTEVEERLGPTRLDSLCLRALHSHCTSPSTLASPAPSRVESP